MKLEYKNNWGMDEYYVDGNRIKDLKTVQIGDWEYSVFPNRMVEEISDHGHISYAPSIHYFVTETVFGVPMDFDLNTIVDRIEVIAIDYET